MEASADFPLKVGRKNSPNSSVGLDNPILLDESATATFLGGLSVKTLQSWRLRGYGPSFIRVGRLIRYDRQTLLSFLESQRRQSTSQEGE
jgi:hypothetical protein